MDYNSIITKALDENKQIQKGNSWISSWIEWYKGKVPSFHNYKIWNGKKNVKMVKKSLKMFKKVSEDWASLLMNEKVQIVVSKQKELDEILLDMDFYTKANKSVEYGFALSMAALVLSVENIVIEEDEQGNYIMKDSPNAKLDLTVYSANKIVPITFVNNVCIECAFIVENTNETVISVHRINEDTGNYEIVICRKSKVKDDKGNLSQKTYVIDTKSPTAWFVLVHPNIVNNLDVDSPLPISICANAIDELMVIDDIFDSYDQEFVQGKRKTFISSELNTIDEKTGEVTPVFDESDTTVHIIPKGASLNGDKPLIVTSAESLRANDHTIAMRDALNLLSAKVGLGVDYYNFEKGRVMTATQVISEKSDTFRNLKKHECIFEKALSTLIKSLMLAYNNFIADKFDKPNEVSIAFDDSIIEDKTTEKENDKKDVELGTMSKLEYRMKWFGEDEDTAREKLSKIGDPDQAMRISMYLEALNSGVMTFMQFVEKVYPDADNKEEIARQIEELKKASETISVSDVSGLGLYQK